MEKPVLLEIAKRHLHLETLETRHSDDLDFSDQAVWGLKAALEEAFTAGGRVRVKFARKPANLQEVIAAVIPPATHTYEVEVQEHVALDNAEYEALVQNFLASRPWLKDKGGINGNLRRAIKVTSAGKATLFIDPSGYDYARYVGLEVI